MPEPELGVFVDLLRMEGRFLGAVGAMIADVQEDTNEVLGVCLGVVVRCWKFCGRGEIWGRPSE